MTVQGVPEGFQPPVVTALSPSSLHVSSSQPARPGGIIQQYHLNQTGVGTIFTHRGGPRNYTVTGTVKIFILHPANSTVSQLSHSSLSFTCFTTLLRFFSICTCLFPQAALFMNCPYRESKAQIHERPQGETKKTHKALTNSQKKHSETLARSGSHS